MPNYCRYCHETGYVVRDCTKRRVRRACWNCGADGHITADCKRDRLLKKQRKLPNSDVVNEQEAKPPAKDSEHVTQIAAVLQDDQEDSMSDVPNESSSELNVEQAFIEYQYGYHNSMNTSANHDVSVNNLDNVNNSSDMEISEEDEFYTDTNAQFVNSPTEST